MRRLLTFFISIGVGLCVLFSGKINAEEATPFQKDMEKLFQQVKANHPHVNYKSFSLSVMDVHTDNYWGVDDQLSTTTAEAGQYGGYLSASVIKFPVSYAIIKLAEKGEIDLYGTYTDPVSLEKFRPIDKIVTAVTRSINAAINTLLRTFTPTVINKELTELGYPNVKMFSEIGGGDPYQSYSNNMKRYGNSLGGRLNSYEMALMLKNFYEDSLNGVPGTEELYNALKNTIYKDRVPKGINYKYPVLHKTGTIGAPDGVYNDCAMILVDEKPFIICFVDRGQKGNTIIPFIREMSKEVTNYMEKATLIDVAPKESIPAEVFPDVEIYIEGERIELGQNIDMFEDQIMVPFRLFSDHLQMNILWDGVLNEVTVYNEELEIKMVIGVSTALVNGMDFELDTKPYIKQGATMVSLDFIAAVFGFDIQRENDDCIIMHLISRPDTDPMIP